MPKAIKRPDILFTLEIAFFVLMLLSLFIFPERFVDRAAAYYMVLAFSFLALLCSAIKVFMKHWVSLSIFIISALILVVVLMLVTMVQY